MSDANLTIDGIFSRINVTLPTPFFDAVRDLEVALIRRAMENAGSVQQAANLLGLKRTTLHVMLEKYGIDNPNSHANRLRKILGNMASEESL